MTATQMTEKTLKRFRKRYGLKQLTQEELERRERAAERLREPLSRNPKYAERIQRSGMKFLRAYHSHAILSD